MADVDSELRVAAQVSGVKIVEVNVQQAQGLSRLRAHGVFSRNRGWIDQAAEERGEHLGERPPQNIDDGRTGLPDLVRADVERGGDLEDIGLVLAKAREHGKIARGGAC